MAPLPDPTPDLGPADRAALQHIASARSTADGHTPLGQVYVNLFNNPGVATAVGALGEHLRFHGVLPDDARELVILRYSARRRLGYEWSHHQHPARLAGLDEETIGAVTAGDVPASLAPGARALLQAVDSVAEHESIPPAVQQDVVTAFGTAGIVELVALCGLYALMGYTVTSFDIPTEPGLPPAPF